MREKYAASNASPIENDLEALAAMGVTPIMGDYLDESPIARHNAKRVTDDLLAVAMLERLKSRGTIAVDAIRH